MPTTLQRLTCFVKMFRLWFYNRIGGGWTGVMWGHGGAPLPAVDACNVDDGGNAYRGVRFVRPQAKRVSYSGL